MFVRVQRGLIIWISSIPSQLLVSKRTVFSSISISWARLKNVRQRDCFSMYVTNRLVAILLSSISGNSTKKVVIHWLQRYRCLIALTLTRFEFIGRSMNIWAFRPSVLTSIVKRKAVCQVSTLSSSFPLDWTFQPRDRNVAHERDVRSCLQGGLSII